MDWKDKLRGLLSGETKKVNPEIQNIEEKWLEQEERSTRPQEGKAPVSEKHSFVQPKTEPKRYIGIGLDFGTSCTKVVIALRIPRSAEGVPFDGLAPNDSPYLLPSKVWVDRNGRFALTPSGMGEWLKDTKVELMRHPWEPLANDLGLSIRAVDAVAAFIGLVLQCAQRWFLKEKAVLLGSNELVWELNVGLPARNYDEATIRDAFRSAAIAGWELAQGREIDLKLATLAVDRAGAGTTPQGIHSDQIQVIPEVAAEVTGYSRSDQRRYGPHLLVDIGATTLDTCLFLLTDSGVQNRYAMLAADVRSDLGAFELHRHRVNSLSRYAQSKLSAADAMPLIPETVDDYIPAEIDLLNFDAEFQEKCTVAAGKTSAAAKRKDPRGLTNPHTNSLGQLKSESMHHEIRVFVCGGGGRMKLYREAMDEAGRRAGPGGKQGQNMLPFVKVPGGLPFPADLSAPKIPKQDYDRLAVAYGLSYSADDIGIFIPPSDISELEKQKSVERIQPSKDDV